MIKLRLIAITCSIFSVLACSAQKNEMKNIKKTIIEFSSAGDENNTEKLATYLDGNYRVVMNRLFGSKEVSVMQRSEYLEKIESKEYGGDKRDLTIEDIVINGTTASARVTFKGSKITFISLIILIQDLEGNWKLICDIPVIK